MNTLAPLTKARAANMAFLYPIRGKKEAIKKETMAMGKSLNASKTLASTSSTP